MHAASEERLDDVRGLIETTPFERDTSRRVRLTGLGHTGMAPTIGVFARGPVGRRMIALHDADGMPRHARNSAPARPARPARSAKPAKPAPTMTTRGMATPPHRPTFSRSPPGHMVAILYPMLRWVGSRPRAVALQQERGSPPRPITRSPMATNRRTRDRRPASGWTRSPR